MRRRFVLRSGQVTLACILGAALGLGLSYHVTPEAEGAVIGGCFECKYYTPVSEWGYCKQVGHEQTGDGIWCETSSPLCLIWGGACYNVDVPDGGGGGGGSGGACTIELGEVCPAECFTCERRYY